MKKIFLFLCIAFTIVHADAQNWISLGVLNNQCLPGGGTIWNTGRGWNGGGPTLIINIERKPDCYYEIQTTTETVVDEYQRDQFGYYVQWNNQYIPLRTHQVTSTRRVKICY